MGAPLTASRIGTLVDPTDREVFAFEISQGPDEADILQAGEEIEDVELAASVDAAAAGLTLLTDYPFNSYRDDRNVLFWTEIDPAFRSNDLFNGVGAPLAVEVTINTSLGRRKQYSVLVWSAQK